MASWASTATVHPEGEVKVKTMRESASSFYANTCPGEEKKVGQSSEAGSTSELARTHASEWLWEELTT